MNVLLENLSSKFQMAEEKKKEKKQKNEKRLKGKCKEARRPIEKKSSIPI